MFLSAYTIFAKNHIIEESDWKKRAKEIKGKAMLHITLKKGIDETIKQQLDAWNVSSMIYHCAGEHDIFLQMNAAKIFSGFDALKWNSDFYNNYIFQTNVQLYDVLENIDKLSAVDKSVQDVSGKKEVSAFENPGRDSQKLGILQPNIILKEYKKLRNELAKQFPSTAGMVDTLDWLYSDYISKMSTASNEMWLEIFSCQFYNVLSSVRKFIQRKETNGLPNGRKLELVNELLCNFERQVSHIAESNNLVLGTPVCQFRYSGQNNLTLYAYFGIIKNVLKHIYLIQETSIQDEIVPMIVTDIVPIIQSQQFFDYGVRGTTKIVSINLPMTALYNPVCYYPYLYHEIFHYIVPRDRYIRNQTIGTLMSIRILHAFLEKLMYEKFTVENGKDLLSVFIGQYLIRYIYNFTVQNYEDYIGKNIEFMPNEALNCLEAGKKMNSSREYEYKVLYKWLNWLNETENISVTNNFIYAFIRYLYLQRNTIKTELATWKKGIRKRQKKTFHLLQEQIDALFIAFGGIADNEEIKSLSGNYQNLINCINENILDEAATLSKAVNEGISDTAMVVLGKLDFAEYLLLYVKTKKDLLMDSKSIEVQDIIRIGLVLQYLHREKPSNENCMGIIDSSKESFVNMYCGLYYSSTQFKDKGCQKYWKKLLREAEEWFDCSKEYYYGYINGYQVYTALFKKAQECMLLFKEGNMRNNIETEQVCYFKTYASELKEYGAFMRSNMEDSDKWSEKHSEVNRHIFDLNMQLIFEHQAQPSFDELKKIHKDVTNKIAKSEYKATDFHLKDTCLSFEAANEIPVIGFENHTWCYEVKDVAELAKLTADIAAMLEESNDRILGKNEYPIWYRGHQSWEYKLIPSLMRKYKEKKEKYANPEDFTLLGFLRQGYEEFKFRSDGMPEAIERAAYTNSDYIALMQHYLVPSNFLDWTEDALSALYFTLEGFFDKKAENPNTDAALYVFSPALYNDARKRMILYYENQDSRKKTMEKDVINIAKQGGIPNLAVPYNQGNYDMYEFGNNAYNQDKVERYDSNDKDKNRWIYYMPLAVYVSRLNRRIQAQSGIFLAYNIYTGTDMQDEFDYVSLEEIQKNYLKRWKEDSNIRPFLYKIKIAESSRQQIANWVKAFGMTKEKCYPELSSIGERIV